MNWGPPPASWVEVTKDTFFSAINRVNYKRTGWGGAIVYEDRHGDEFAVIVENKGHPDRYFIDSVPVFLGD